MVKGGVKGERGGGRRQHAGTEDMGYNIAH